MTDDASQPPSPPAHHDAYAALRIPSYRRFAGGFVFSSAGLQMMGLALGWDLYERTDDPLALGLAGLARALPVVGLALPAGTLIDRLDRRRVLIATQIAMGLFALVLAWFSARAQTPIWSIYMIVALMGCARAFNGPSRATLLPLIVPPDQFHNAVTWNSAIFHYSAAAGPAVAGLLIAGFGAAWPVYLVTAGGCLVLAVSACFVEVRPSPRRHEPATLRSMFAGAAHVWREKTLLSALTLDLFAVLLGGSVALLPVYAKDILHVGPAELGLLRAATPVGAVLMALVIAHRPAIQRTGRALLLSVAAFGVATIVFGLSTNWYLSLAALLAAGAVDNISVVVRHVLVQVRTPNELRGRVSAVNSVFIECSNELGAFESGLVARLLGPVFSVVSGGVGTIVVVVGVALAWPELRRLGRLREEPEPRAERTADAEAAGAGRTPGAAALNNRA